MVGTSSPTSSSSSSCLSIGSFADDVASTKSSSTTIKFLCSYGGKILPRHPDGKLRYVGGDTRVLSVDRSVTFSGPLACLFAAMLFSVFNPDVRIIDCFSFCLIESELLAKMGELCGWGAAVSLRCQMPTEDLDALVSVTSDEDLANLIEEYDLAAGSTVHPPKIRAFLHPPPPPSSKVNSVRTTRPPVPAAAATHRCVHHHAAARFSVAGRTGHGARRVQHHHQHPPHQNQQLPAVHHGNHWQ
ncbi:uncharacterized protein M6B38_265685 [Iris pallida]|uniref:PB1 domain-containing protein n=1 Tax=Iris pallida TaxID=29817 RepID=A0AAX6HLH8_IRIPA|nr:uncharacterized protein M6B38_306005 [Iris pallida]KAJ6847642.1 uncharacterized protein M6B38_276560 [Iris pallida]KAJ6850069.1 uncharacterized protein M6B38_265685 [Iris pallida]